MKDQRLINTLAKAGFKGPSLETAYAVAKAESGGRPTAFNPDASTGDRSYGLFQINMLGDLGPARRRQFGLRSNEDLYDPLTNARVAYRMSGGGKDWTPWSAYKSGAHRKYLGQVPRPSPGGTLPRPTPGGGGLKSRSSLSTGRDQRRTLSAEAPSPSTPERRLTGGGIDATKLAQAILSGQDITEAVTSAEIPYEWVDKIPRYPKPVAEVKAARYGGTVENAGPAPGPNDKVTQAIAIAKQQIGKPYVWAAASPGVGFDCSGLIEYAFETAGIPTPGRLTTGPMKKMGKQVGWENVQPGDWIVKHEGGSGHVVMYVGNGQVIAAPRRGEVVQYQPVSRFSSDPRYTVRRWSGG